MLQIGNPHELWNLTLQQNKESSTFEDSSIQLEYEDNKNSANF